MTDLEPMAKLLTAIKHTAVAKAHWKDNAGWQIAEAVDAVYQEASKELLDAAHFISISLDEATTVDNMAVMCVHAYVLVGFERKQIFLALKDVKEAPNADELLRTLQSVLEASSLPDSVLQRKLVALGTDGASVMVGPHSGLAIKARQQLAPFSASVHCAAHRVSLAASTMDKHRNVQRLTRAVENINQHFCKSPARTQKYKSLCLSLGLKGQLIGRAAPTRWLSLRKPAERLVRDIRSLVPYFDSASTGISSLLTELPTLLAACGLLPILRSLSRLSLLCQSRAIFVEDLMQEVAQTADKITAMYTGPLSFSALDFPELTAFANVEGPDSCLVYTGSGYLAVQPHGSNSVAGQADGDNSDSEEDEEEGIGSRQAASDMETAFGGPEEEEAFEPASVLVQLHAIPPRGRRAAPVPASDFQEHLNCAKQELGATATAVVRDLGSRFMPPEHAKGLAVVYAHYWDKQPSNEDFLLRLAIVKARYCAEATLVSGDPKLSTVPASSPAEQTTKLWRYLDGQPITKADISEYIKLAELALVMTPGSVEEERMFSAMAYLKDDTRNRLQECHLNVCARVFSSKHFELDTFPFERAISKWFGLQGLDVTLAPYTAYGDGDLTWQQLWLNTSGIPIASKVPSSLTTAVDPEGPLLLPEPSPPSTSYTPHPPTASIADLTLGPTSPTPYPSPDSGPGPSPSRSSTSEPAPSTAVSQPSLQPASSAGNVAGIAGGAAAAALLLCCAMLLAACLIKRQAGGGGSPLVEGDMQCPPCLKLYKVTSPGALAGLGCWRTRRPCKSDTKSTDSGCTSCRQAATGRLSPTPSCQPTPTDSSPDASLLSHTCIVRLGPPTHPDPTPAPHPHQAIPTGFSGGCLAYLHDAGWVQHHPHNKPLNCELRPEQVPAPAAASPNSIMGPRTQTNWASQVLLTWYPIGRDIEPTCAALPACQAAVDIHLVCTSRSESREGEAGRQADSSSVSKDLSLDPDCKVWHRHDGGDGGGSGARVSSGYGDEGSTTWLSEAGKAALRKLGMRPLVLDAGSPARLPVARQQAVLHVVACQQSRARPDQRGQLAPRPATSPQLSSQAHRAQQQGSWPQLLEQQGQEGGLRRQEGGLQGQEGGLQGQEGGLQESGDLHEPEEHEDVRLEAFLGAGAYGAVFRATWRGMQATNSCAKLHCPHPAATLLLYCMLRQVAVKRLQFSSLVGQEQASVQRRQVLMEAELNAGLSHRNLMATYAYHVRAVGDSSSDQGVRDWVLQLVCELCSGGSLYDAMAKGRLWDTESSLPVLGLVLAIMGDVADAMPLTRPAHLDLLAPALAYLDLFAPALAYLHLGLPCHLQAYVHSRNILHMDLKPENVLLKPEGSGLVAKVADLGLSAVMGPNRTHLSQAWAGTPLYRAPEVALHGRASPAADVYSFGVMAWELLHGCFAAQRLQQLTQEPRHLLFLEPHPELFASHCPPHPPRPTATQAQPVLQGLQDLVHNCLQHQPQARPTFPDLVQRLNVLAERQLKAQAVGARRLRGPFVPRALVVTVRAEVRVAVRRQLAGSVSCPGVMADADEPEQLFNRVVLPSSEVLRRCKKGKHAADWLFQCNIVAVAVADTSIVAESTIVTGTHALTQPGVDGSIMLSVKQYAPVKQKEGPARIELQQFRLSLREVVDKLNEQMPSYIWHHFVAHHQLAVFRRQQLAVQEKGDHGRVVISCDWSERLSVERPTEIQSYHWHHHNVGIFVACAYFRNDRDDYREETVYVLTDGKDQSAAVTQAALHQVLDYLQGERCMVMKQLCMWSDGCAAQFKGTPALQLHRRMAMRYKVSMWWSYGATSHFKGRHDSEGGVFKHSMAARVLADHPDLSAECKAQQMAGVHNVECVVPAAQLAASVAHQTRGSVQRRWCLVLKDEEVEQCAEPDPDAHRLLRTISGSRAMHAMSFPADGVAPMWSETACACVRHMASKPQQCMCHGASTLSSIPMFGRVTLASDKEEDVQCLKLLHARAPHIASSYMTLTVYLLKEYARGCLGWKGKRLTQNKPLLRADILEHLRWEQEMEEDQLAEVGVDEADDIAAATGDQRIHLSTASTSSTQGEGQANQALPDSPAGTAAPSFTPKPVTPSLPATPDTQPQPVVPTILLNMMSSASDVKPLTSLQYSSSSDDRSGVQRIWFTSLYKQLNYISKIGAVPTFTGRQRPVFELVEQEFEGLYTKYVKGQQLDEQSQRSLMMCCLAIATYRVLNDELGDTKMVREIIRTNLGGLMVSLLLPVHRFKLWLLRYLFMEDMYQQALRMLPALTADMGRLCSSSVVAEGGEGSGTTLLTVHKCRFHEVLTQEDAPFLLTEFCCHQGLQWLDAYSCLASLAAVSSPACAPKQQPQLLGANMEASPARMKATDVGLVLMTTVIMAIACQMRCHNQPTQQPGERVDRDCNAALNMQGSGELCKWPGLPGMPANGEAYPALGCKRVRDKPPKAQQQQPVAQYQPGSHTAASEPGPSTPPPAKRSKRTKAEQVAEPTQPTKGTGKGKGRDAKPKHHHSRAALNMQRIGKSKCCPLELCWWPGRPELPAEGKEYPELGYKRLQDRPPSSSSLQHGS
ncbi:hypothetical protein QJQ45_024482, partial [Haematococcus lacustris]